MITLVNLLYRLGSKVNESLENMRQGFLETEGRERRLMPFPTLVAFTLYYTLDIHVICKTGGLKGLKRRSPGIEKYLNFGRTFFEDISLKVADT